MEIKLEKLQKYHDSREILNIAYFTFKKGLIHQLSGTNGAGKSTLFDILSLLDADYAGQVRFDDQDIRTIPRDGSIVTQVFQKPVMLNRTVRENIMYPLKLKGIADELIAEQLDFYLSYLPLGFLLDQKATKLSLGEAQKVSLIRGLMLKTPILLLDEPFSAMDRVSRENGLEMIFAHQNLHHSTILVISHREIEHEMMNQVILEGGTLQ